MHLGRSYRQMWADGGLGLQCLGAIAAGGNWDLQDMLFLVGGSYLGDYVAVFTRCVEVVSGAEESGVQFSTNCIRDLCLG